MWYLTSENDNRVLYINSSTNQLVIGRSVDNQVCNFAIPDDPSISRKHATLTMTNNGLVLQDLGSRYGTFINTEKAEANNNIELNANDIIKFGKMNSVWKVNVINLITCSSTLKGENLQNLRLTLSKIGGMLKADWDDTCNFLTMPAITLTIKVVLALVQGSHIVTVEFWNKSLEHVTNLSALPDPQDYLPQVVESTLNKEVVSFLPDARRKTLFSGKNFIFFSRRQYEMYKAVLIKGGASPMLLSECRMTISMLCANDIIVIQYISSGASQETQSQRKTINDIVTQLKNKGKRVIADAEIGLAILYCSMEKYCNPNFSFTSEVVKQTSVPPKASKVLAQESQDPMSQQKKENIRIDESSMSQENYEKHSNKRKLSEFTSDFQVNPNKKVAVNCMPLNVVNESTKRRLSGNDDKTSNPSKKQALEKDKNTETINLPEQDDENSSEMFNFIRPVANSSGADTKKKLNLARPQKRKLNNMNEEGDLFNFVQSEVQTNDVEADTHTSKQSLFSNNKKKRDESEDTSAVSSTAPKTEGVSVDDISAMRGSKLKELMERNLTCNTKTVNAVKKEKSEDLEEQMNKLDLCCTIVTTCDNLIVKREPVIVTENSLRNDTQKNFKKFKKVWPVKRQVTIIPSSSMSFSNNTVA
uniref:FHA domain-containing protein n=1 Tax=Heliothis virescens TaxID=7102 RepID=A0A2A4JMW9_HELVI